MVAAAIIDAPAGCPGLPERALERLGERSVLSHAIHRARRIPGVSLAIAALPEGCAPDLVEEAAEAGAMACLGPAGDPLGRLYAAAREAGADRIVYLRAAHPFFDPALAGGVLALLTDARADFASNTMPALFPHGLDCEAFDAALLDAAQRSTLTAAERADPTLWMRRHARLCKANLAGPGGGLENLRWVLESEIDLAFFRAVFDALGAQAGDATAAEIAALCLRRPDIAALNAPLADAKRLTPPVRAGGEIVQTAPVRFMMAG